MVEDGQAPSSYEQAVDAAENVNQAAAFQTLWLA
jgi:hypothetical protein